MDGKALCVLSPSCCCSQHKGTTRVELWERAYSGVVGLPWAKILLGNMWDLIRGGAGERQG